MRKLLFLLPAIVLAACTTVTVTPESALAPTQTYTAVVLTKVTVKDPEFSYLGPFFREAFIRRLKELKAFPSVADAASAPVADGASAPGAHGASVPVAAAPALPGTIDVSATITNVNKGNAALRFLVGMGAGREHITAQVHLTSANGTPISEFEVRKAYSGGFGIGGITMIDIEGLTKQLGEQCAQSLVDWSKGKVVAQAQ